MSFELKWFWGDIVVCLLLQVKRVTSSQDEVPVSIVIILSVKEEQPTVILGPR